MFIVRVTKKREQIYREGEGDNEGEGDSITRHVNLLILEDKGKEKTQLLLCHACPEYLDLSFNPKKDPVLFDIKVNEKDFEKLKLGELYSVKHLDLSCFNELWAFEFKAYKNKKK